MNDKAIELYFNFLGMHDHNLATLETLALDNMELRFKLYGACNSEQGQYMSFVKKTDPNVLTANTCVFENKEAELKAKQNLEIPYSESAISYSHPCFEQEMETLYVILIFITIFIVIATITNIYDIIRMSSHTSCNYNIDLSKRFLRSGKRK